MSSLAKAYVEWELTAQNLTFSQACELIEVPEATVEAFLAAPFSFDHGTTVKIIIILGAILGSPVELARVCGYRV